MVNRLKVTIESGFRAQLGISIIGIFITSACFSKTHVGKEKFSVDDVTVTLKGAQYVKTPQGSVCEALCRLELVKGGKKIHESEICSAEAADVKVILKGYLTLVEHYSSPVGWSQFYIFDFCKMRLILTNKLQESPALEWEKFINIDEKLKARYVEKIVQLE